MREKMAKEALERMKILGLESSCIKQFEESGTVFYSERTKLGGILYWLDNEEHFVSAVKEFEKESKCLVYHCTHEHTDFGECLSMLYVTDDDEEWDMDRDDLRHGDNINGYLQYAYVANLSDPMCSEYGSIKVVNRAGGLIRIA